MPGVKERVVFPALLIEQAQRFECWARQRLEFYRWGGNPRCPACGSVDPIYLQSRNGKEGYYRCDKPHLAHDLEIVDVCNISGVPPEPAVLEDIFDPSLESLEYSDEDESVGSVASTEVRPVKATYHPFGPKGSYTLNGFEDEWGPSRPLVFSVRYKSMLSRSHVPLSIWLLFLKYLWDQKSIADICRIVGVTRKTATRMRKDAMQQLQTRRPANMFILEALDEIKLHLRDSKIDDELLSAICRINLRPPQQG